MIFSFLKSLIKLIQLMYYHKVMIHNLTKPINSSMQDYSGLEQSNTVHLLFYNSKNINPTLLKFLPDNENNLMSTA